MVARRKLEDFASPVGDGLPTRLIAPHSTQKIHYLWKYADTAALATASPRAFPGARTYADLYASCGICETKKTHELSWGSALACLQITMPFDLYFLNDIDPKMAAALAERVESVGIAGATVFELDTREPDAFAHARRIAEVVTPFGPKVVVATGDANTAARYLAELMRPFGKRRYLLAFIDPFSAGYHWNAFQELAMYERAMDVLALFPTAMDLGRNFSYYRNSPASGVKLDDYFGCEWRHLVDANPKHAEHDLRVLYEQQMTKILDFQIGHPKGVGFTRVPLYHLIFGSKSEFGMKLWNNVNRRDAFEQEELWLDGA
jgi:three-Cys-motif partner protein